ncbi:hypothetical protein BY996DRAFT_8477316 [Phakopsora pachyrhizi]|nr:hypothetical protein BY996DRAFT_8477316 [Phakopsora pachyrhizi]
MASGFTWKISHLDGHNITLNSKSVIQPGFVQVIEGEGMPRHRAMGSYCGTNGANKTVIKPFSYFEIYWASEANISKVYKTEPYNRGIHMMHGGVLELQVFAS